MSRGKQGVFTFVAALAMVATMAVAPVSAVTTSGSVAATDDRAPGPVANVVAFPGPDGVEVTWDLSLSDFVRQSPSGSDFTAGGTFTNVNNVAGYNIWRGEGALAPELIGTVLPGEVKFVDPLPVGASFVYSVTATDKAGNESAAEASLEITLGPPPVALIGPLGDIVLGDIAADGSASASIDIANDATEADAILNVSASVEGAGFSVSDSTLALVTGASAVLGVTFDAAAVGNINGEYTAVVTMRTNDSNNREVVIGVSASITTGLVGAPIVNVSTPSVAYGVRLIGATGSRAVVVSNAGGLLLTGSIAVDGTAFSADATDISLDAGESLTVNVSFAPASLGAFSGSLVITSNDANSPEVTVSLSGIGVDEITTPNVVQTPVTTATLTLTDTDSLDFTDQAAIDAFVALLVADLAELLGIDASRIKGVTVSQGSIVVAFTIAKTTDTTAVSASDALAALETAVADTTTDALPSNPTSALNRAVSVAGATTVIAYVPVTAGDEPVFGWFTRTEDQVGFNDFFAFADNFGVNNSDPTFDASFDIAPTAAPNGAIDFDDFFLFADNFGRVVANAATIRSALDE